MFAYTFSGWVGTYLCVKTSIIIDSKRRLQDFIPRFVNIFAYCQNQGIYFINCILNESCRTLKIQQYLICSQHSELMVEIGQNGIVKSELSTVVEKPDNLSMAHMSMQLSLWKNVHKQAHEASSYIK